MRLLPCDLPIVFRPHEAESLSSWIARIAGVYYLEASALLSECSSLSRQVLRTIDFEPSLLVIKDLGRITRLDEASVGRQTIRSMYPGWLPEWVTLRPGRWNTCSQLTVRPEGAQFNFCRACLSDDLAAGGQFFRLAWLNAGTTICGRHLLLMDECEDSDDLPFACQQTKLGTRFFSTSTGNPLDSSRGDKGVAKEVALLASFEESIRQALSADPRSLVFGCDSTATAGEFLSITQDLTWALLMPIARDGTRLLHVLHTEVFPPPRGLRLPSEIHGLAQASALQRRSVLAVIAHLLQPDKFSLFTRVSRPLGSRFAHHELLNLLGVEQAAIFLTWAHRWPACFREKVLRAA